MRAASQNRPGICAPTIAIDWSARAHGTRANVARHAASADPCSCDRRNRRCRQRVPVSSAIAVRCLHGMSVYNDRRRWSFCHGTVQRHGLAPGAGHCLIKTARAVPMAEPASVHPECTDCAGRGRSPRPKSRMGTNIVARPNRPFQTSAGAVPACPCGQTNPWIQAGLPRLRRLRQSLRLGQYG
jgi:hypothetical protein